MRWCRTKYPNYVLDTPSHKGVVFGHRMGTMVMDRFSEDRFHDENAARAFLEGVLWPDGPICPHCGVINHAYPSKRPGVYRCAEPACRQDFTVTMNTVMERSPYRAAQMVASFPPDVQQQERHFRSPTASDIGHWIQSRMVHVPSYPRSDARWWRLGTAGR